MTLADVFLHPTEGVMMGIVARRLMRHSRQAVLMMATVLAACGGGGGGDSGGGGAGGGSPVAPTPGPAPAPGPTPTSYTVSGSVSVTEPSAIDSDTNDPNQTNRRDNGSFATAQALSSPVQVVGYVAMPGGAPNGATGAGGDLHDGYKVSLLAGQIVELEFAADPSRYDLDLSIYTPAGDLVGQSNGVNQSECVRIAAAGEYVIGVETYSRGSTGGSIYQLRISAPNPGHSCDNATATDADLIANRIMAVAEPTASVATKSAAATDIVSGRAEPDRLHLISMPAGAAHQQATRSLQALAFQRKGVAATSSAADEAIESQSSAWRQGMTDRARALRDTVDYAKLLVASGAYRSATPDRRVTIQQSTNWPSYPPNDREFSKQAWHYNAINLPAAAAALQRVDLSGSPAPIVAVIDTGIVADHPDLANQLVAGYDMISDVDSAGDGNGPDANPDDASTSATSVFHGTHVAGTIAAQAGNGIGGTGIAPMARIMPIRALGVEGSGSLYDIIEGVRFAAGLPTDRGVSPARKADILNLSLGSSGSCPAAVAQVFAAVRAAGTLVVIAAGNESRGTQLAPVGSPANCAGVWSVAATDASNERSPYSNVGPENAFAVPGGNTAVSTTGNGLPDGVYSTMATVSNRQRQPTYGFLQGTSMATPHAAGILALMRWAYPAITADQIDTLLRNGTIVDDLGAAGRDSSFGYGLLNARKAVEAALAMRTGGPPTPAPGQVQARPASISLGATRTEADLVLVMEGTSSERVASVTADSAAITVGPKSDSSVDATTGLGTYRVQANRSALNVGTSAFPNVVITMVPDRTLRVPVTVSRGGADGALGTLGPIYIVVADPNTQFRSVGGTMIADPAAGLYKYSVTVPGTRSIVVFAGNDLDNNGTICDSGEGCGAYPSLASEVTVLQPTASLTGIDFSVWPIGGVRPAALGAAGAAGAGTGPFEGIRR